jgi:hypothetical protein
VAVAEERRAPQPASTVRRQRAAARRTKAYFLCLKKKNGLLPGWLSEPSAAGSLGLVTMNILVPLFPSLNPKNGLRAISSGR